MTKDDRKQLNDVLWIATKGIALDNCVDFDIEYLTAKDCWGESAQDNIDKASVVQITFRLSADVDLKQYQNHNGTALKK